jgi:hypothetical protein
MLALTWKIKFKKSTLHPINTFIARVVGTIVRVMDEIKFNALVVIGDDMSLKMQRFLVNFVSQDLMMCIS